MKISYKIDTKQKIIIETWPEKLSVEDYYDVKKREFDDPEFSSEFDVITDLRQVKGSFNEKMIFEIIEFMKKYNTKMQNRKSAIVADSPQTVASSLFFGNKTNKLKVEVSVFSTINAAKKWIKEKW